MPLPTQQSPPWLEHSLRQAAGLAGVPGLPDDAVLCIRHLQADIDTRILRQRRGVVDTAEQLSLLLHRQASAAGRPAYGPVPANAMAVLFDTQDQLLACAARDWLQGDFERCWWWRVLVGDHLVARGPVILWQRHPAHIPAALAELERQGNQAAAFCHRIPRSDADALLAALLACYPHGSDSAQSVSTPKSGLPPAFSITPDAGQHLLELGLTLAGVGECPRRPASASVDQVVRDRLTAFDAPALPAVDRIRAPPPVRPASARDNTEPSEDRHVMRPIVRYRAILPDEIATNDPDSPFDALAPAVPKTPAPQPEKRAPQPTVPGPRGQRPASPLPAPAIAASDRERRESPQSPTTRRGERIDTQYGGVLYLLNVAIGLGLYPDFTRPAERGLGLSPWAFLAQMGYRLLGRRRHKDPLWDLLHSLAARQGSDSSPPDALPDGLRDFAGRRPSGRAGIDTSDSGHTSDTGDRWTGWFDQLLPPLRRRLAAALGVPARDTGTLLCHQAARIRLVAPRLEACFSLDQHPIAIRLAGLDRDPGWIPAAELDVRFVHVRDVEY